MQKQKGVMVRTRPQIFLMLSLLFLHGLGWLGVSQLAAALISSPRQIRCVRILILVFYAGEWGLRWRGLLLSRTYTVQWLLYAEILLLLGYGGYTGNAGVSVCAAVLCVSAIPGHMWCTYLQRISVYLEQNGSLDHVPGGSIFTMNTRVVLRFLLVPGLVGGVAFLMRTDAVADWLCRLLYRAIHLLVMAIRTAAAWWHALRGGSDAEKMLPLETTAVSDTFAAAMPAGEGDGWPVIAALTVTGLLILAVFVRMICMTRPPKDPPGSPRPAFHHKAGRDMVEEIPTEPVHRFLFLGTNRERVRYFFKKQMLRHYRKHVPKSYTAGEMCRDIGQEQDAAQEQMSALKQLYEKARYSTREISGAELRRLKKSSRRKGKGESRA